MGLYLINPSNPLVSLANFSESRWNRYRVWKPLSLMVLAGLAPLGWDIKIVGGNLGAYLRSLGVPVVMGGIHPTVGRGLGEANPPHSSAGLGTKWDRNDTWLGKYGTARKPFE